VSLLLGCAGTLYAQSAPEVDLGVTYVSQRSLKANTGENFWSQGGSVELGVDAWRGLGVAADVTGVHAASIGSSGIPLSMVVVTFGPRYRWHSSHRLSVYGLGLLGEADAFRSLFPSTSAADVSANSLALHIGGGLDLRLSKRFAIRALDAAWLRTQLPNSTNNRQNSFRLGAGIVVRFGA
jgi:hypothetical protein